MDIDRTSIRSEQPLEFAATGDGAGSVKRVKMVNIGIGHTNKLQGGHELSPEYVLRKSAARMRSEALNTPRPSLSSLRLGMEMTSSEPFSSC